jgi:NADP-dependent 3-hydroxy acid dehydrogenase YdfG
MIPNSENKRVWFITGASKGLGYAFTCAALKAGDKVVAVARTIDNLAKLEETYQESLLPLNLDVTDREAVFSTVETAVKHFGRLDIVVNNAGIMTMGMIEELNESDARKLMDTNFFGALWVCQAVMPYLSSVLDISYRLQALALLSRVRCLVFTVQVNLRWKE